MPAVGSAGGRGGPRSATLDPNEIAAKAIGVEIYDNLFILLRVETHAGKVCGKRKSATTAIHQYGEFHFIGPAMIEQFIKRSLGGTTREKHVINEDDVLAVNIPWDVGGRDILRNRMVSDVIAVEGNIQGACKHGLAGIPCRQEPGEPAGEFRAAIGDAEQEQPWRAAVAFGNSRGELCDGSLDCR